MISRHEADDLLAGLVGYLRSRELMSNWLRHRIGLVLSQKAKENNRASARSFCFVVLGAYDIHYADALLKLPMEFIVGILLHEIAHMLVHEGADPELDVDEWVLERVPEAGYTYKNTAYGRRRAKNLECVSRDFCELIQSMAQFRS